jgi:uncharacterized membrane protein YhaH (DUF805 family)
MGFIEATKTGFRSTFDFTGRASRPEFWWFLLAIFIVIPMGFFVLVSIFPPLVFIFLLYQLWIMIAVTSVCIRRIRDAGGTFWWFLGQHIALVIAIISMYPMMSAISDNIENSQAAQDAITQGGSMIVITIAGIANLACSIVCLVYYFKPSK